MTTAVQTKCVKSPDGTIRYIKDNKLHKSEGPALIHPMVKKNFT